MLRQFVFICCRCTCLTVLIPATVDHHSDKVVHAVEVDSVYRCVEEAELQWKDHSIAQFSVPMQLLHVLKSLQMKSQDHGQLLHTHTATDTHAHKTNHWHVEIHIAVYRAAPKHFFHTKVLSYLYCLIHFMLKKIHCLNKSHTN